MNIYIAGGLFNEAEIRQRLFEEKEIKERFKDIVVFNPISQPFNENKSDLPTCQEIFENDYNAVRNCDILLCDITNEDPGVMCEIGIAITLNKFIIAVNSDIRLKSSNKYDIPTYGVNHFVLGGIYKNGVFVYSFKEALDKIGELYERK